MSKNVYIETLGCQMNKLDSELICDQLTEAGYEFTNDADAADVIIFNTCSVRQHAEDKVVSKIGQLGRQNRRNDDVALAILGCMAQRLGEQLLDQYKQIDIVCSPGQAHRLVDVIERYRKDGNRVCLLNDEPDDDGRQLEELDTSRQRYDAKMPFMAYVRVMRGCENYCSYCVVPSVRGPVRSRPIDNIVSESQKLAEKGVKEITLLGQAVDMYEYHTNDGRICRLAEVLRKVHQIDGLERIRFVTNYPRDLDEELLQAVAELPKVCEYLHAPAQSGSDKILKAMNRHYTAKEYLEMVERARKIIPDVTIAGDFIVGFCGETEEDFMATKELVQKVRYKNCFIFKYSPRPNTKAALQMADDVPEEIKRQRNTELLELQNQIAYEDNQKLVGRTVEVLAEGASKKPHLNGKNDKKAKSIQLVGRTRGDHIAVFDGTEDYKGQIVQVKLTKASALTLFGQIK